MRDRFLEEWEAAIRVQGVRDPRDWWKGEEDDNEDEDKEEGVALPIRLRQSGQ